MYTNCTVVYCTVAIVRFIDLLETINERVKIGCTVIAFTFRQQGSIRSWVIEAVLRQYEGKTSKTIKYTENIKSSD